MRTYDIFKEFSSDIYEAASPFSGSCALEKNELLIDGNWSVVIPEKQQAQIEMAAKDLAAFLLKRGGCNIRIVHGQEADNHKSRICLKIDDNITGPESYQLKVDGGNVYVNGADASGVIYGVFYLEELLNFRNAPVVKKMNERRSPVLETRIFRSPMAFYYHNEFEHFDFAYPDNYLLKMAHNGFNGIWCRGVLKELVKTGIFTEFNSQSDFLLSKLNAFIKRAAKFGIRVYLFFTEPMGLREDAPFFKKYPELKGALSYAGTCAMCTSEQAVKDYLYYGFRQLIEQTQGLGGVILITASEHQTHCYSHVSTFGGDIVKCPKCARRTPAEIVSEIISLINSGIKSVSRDVKVIAWNWSWSYFEGDPQKNIIGMLPDDVILMADFERGGKRIADGMEHYVDEYSLSYIGPSERFRGAINAAKERGMKFYAKLQIGVTHEIATVPYFPVPFKLVEKFTKAGECGVSGAMECWNFGNILSLNTELANWFSWKPYPVNADEFLRKIAVREYGAPSADLFVQAWRIFGKATDYYPFSNPYIYDCPMHHGGAQPLFFKKIDKPLALTWLLPNEIKYNAYEELMSRGDYGDDISSICKKFGVQGTLSLLNKMCDEWALGVHKLKAAVDLASGAYTKNALKAYSVAAAILSQFKSASNFISFTSLRNEFHDCNDLENKIAILKKMETIAYNEKENAEELIRLLPMEKALGFHGEAFGYIYNKEKIEKKLTNLDLMLKSELMPEKQRLEKEVPV